MASAEEIFHLSGPIHLTAIDWNNIYHRRSVAASLVKGVYMLEHDRRQNRHGPQALALPWWDFFHFKLDHMLIDDVDLSICGAIYEYKYPSPALNIPQYVIAFRGTIMESDTVSRDFKLNLKSILNKLHRSSRFQLAMHCVHNTVALSRGASVWLTGHSLGSAMALLVGKNMAKIGYFLETYLFNPPFLSLPIEGGFKNETLKLGIRFANSVVKAGLMVAVKGRKHRKAQAYDPFVVLSPWVPYLFVNPDDPICSEYIGYFEHRRKMEEIGVGKIERLATKNSMRNLFSSVLGINSGAEALHLLPSAYLTVNRGRLSDFYGAHGLQQWWNPYFPCEAMFYRYNTTT
ncbi:GDSL esterase/lipase At4g10955-like [Quercus lobata]|uniref:GDSL esterase/lipase At4g10955-like n=1 Tax=Quercus lobata TaxID=97700 RepID=UPI001243D04D|nr:GDSL esterase/lipase At4g10955-like [Quercus lobata]